jgi:hypothetical protein
VLELRLNKHKKERKRKSKEDGPSTQAPVTFDMTTPKFSQVHDLASSENPSTNKDDTEEYEGNNESMSTNKDDDAQKDESNSDYLEKASNALTGMPVTAAARSEKIYDVAAASLLTILKADEERLSTDAFAAEGYGPEDEEEDLNLALILIFNMSV